MCVRVCVCMHVYMCMRVCACVRVSHDVCVCVCLCVGVDAGGTCLYSLLCVFVHVYSCDLSHV